MKAFHQEERGLAMTPTASFPSLLVLNLSGRQLGKQAALLQHFLSDVLQVHTRAVVSFKVIPALHLGETKAQQSSPVN